jgi:focal adhesion kinase 1
MWEILSYGAKPYQGVKNVDVVRLIEEKKVLEKPSTCPNELYAILLNCWEYDSADRPSFSQLKEKLQ